MLNPSNKITSMQLNGDNITNFAASSASGEGLNAKSGNKLQWIIKTKPIQDITSIGLIDGSNIQGQIQYEVHGDFDSIGDVTGEYVGQIVPIKGESVDTITVTTDTTTTDGLPPRNLKLIVKGCFKEELLRTKAQIEQKPTTSTGK